MHRLVGVPQHYAWGDEHTIPALLGAEPDGRPWAELWFGTHPGGPATLDDGRPLADVSGPLPYLLKVLAAGEALSLQTHPSAARAAAGFAREDAAGVPHDAAHRIYRDPLAKPEMIVALTPFDALCGFRPVVATRELLAHLGATDLATRLADDGLPAVVEALYRGRIDTTPIVAACHHHLCPEAMLVTALAEQYPDDPSVAVTLLLNRVTLAPGEAIFLDAGNLHAYLHGVGVEVMGASDNVVRGGLTPKHIDVDELLDVFDIAPLADPVVRPVRDGAWWSYPTPGTPFQVSRADVTADALGHMASSRELLLCTSGPVSPLGTGGVAYLAPGESITLTGPGTVFRVTEP